MNGRTIARLKCFIFMKRIFILISTLIFSFGVLHAQQQGDKHEIREVVLSGSGYELGLQHGQKLKSEIDDIVKKWKKNASLVKDVEKVLDEFFEYADFATAIKKWTPDLYDEVRGIADGSGQNFRDIYVLNLLDEFWVYRQGKLHHCSGLGVPARNGNPGYIAQNMDIESYTEGHQVLMRILASDGNPEQLILTHPGLIALNGMNKEGIGVCVNTIMQLKASNSGLPVAFVVRGIINRTDGGDVKDFLNTVNHASGQNYLLGIKGEVYDFEASANKVVRYNPENENGTVYHTNHPIVNDDLKDWYKAYAPGQTDNKRLKKSNSYVRLEAVSSRVAENINVDDLIIKDALRSKDSKLHPVCRTLKNKLSGFTFASIIMTHSGEPYIQLTAGPPDESEYVKFTFTDM